MEKQQLKDSRLLYSGLLIILSFILVFQVYSIINTQFRMNYITNPENVKISPIKIKPMQTAEPGFTNDFVKATSNPFDPGKFQRFLSSTNQKKKTFNYKLSAILSEKDEKVALLTNSNNQTLTVRRGDSVTGWKVKSIDQDSITLTYNGTSLTLNLW